ncbi:MAG TPA: hypothetical protein VIF12_03465 [Micavibrio sp.]
MAPMGGIDTWIPSDEKVPFKIKNISVEQNNAALAFATLADQDK